MESYTHRKGYTINTFHHHSSVESAGIPAFDIVESNLGDGRVAYLYNYNSHCSPSFTSYREAVEAVYRLIERGL